MFINVQVAEVAIFMIFILKIIEKKKLNYLHIFPNPDILQNIGKIQNIILTRFSGMFFSSVSLRSPFQLHNIPTCPKVNS